MSSGAGYARPSAACRAHVVEEMHVGAQFFFAAPVARGADDEAAGMPLRLACSTRFSRERSSSLGILRDTPMWSTVGMYTRKRPAARCAR